MKCGRSKRATGQRVLATTMQLDPAPPREMLERKAKRRVTPAMSAEPSRNKPAADRGAARAGRRPPILEHLLGIHTRSRRAISEHRHRRKLREREVSGPSRRGLRLTDCF